MKIDDIILNDLIKIYEKRNANSSNFKTKIKIKLNKEKYPKYFDNRVEFDEAIRRLVDKGYIGTKNLPRDTVIDYIFLQLDKVNEIERYLGIKGVNYKRQKLLEEITKYNDPIIVREKNKILFNIENGKSIKQYLKDEYIDSIKAVHYLENLDHDIYERNASNYIYNDSKKLSKLKSLINGIYESDDIFLEKGIMSVTPYLYIKGEGIVYINKEKIDLALIDNSIGIPIDNAEIIRFENINKVTTIENLTTFHDYKSDGLVIYLGGFSTRNQINVLKKLKEVCAKFYHFGDIDFGGFTILLNLMDSLNMHITAINMDVDTLKTNITFAQPIMDDEYIYKLKTLLTKQELKEHYEVIEYLIKHRVWLEQESFYNI